MSENQSGQIRTNADLRDLSFVLRNLFRVGSVSAADILREAGNMMPKFRVQLHAGSSQISNSGWSFSESVKSIFPDNTLAAIKAGEESGRLEAVFDQIWRSATTQEEINKVLRGLMMPVALIFSGILVSLGFFLVLIPFVYGKMAQGAPKEFVPNIAITKSVELNAMIAANPEATIMGVGIFFGALVLWLSRASARDAVVDFVINNMIKFKPVGVAYSHLKFGIMAQYLQIVSMAGLNADRRIDLVMDVLPEPLRHGMRAFRAEVFNKGLSAAASAENRADGDPRTDDVQWPPYIRLAFSQCNEGNWEVPMREFGNVLIEDGKEKMKRQIGFLQNLSFAIVGVLVVVPIGLLYTAMGEVLTMRMQML